MKYFMTTLSFKLRRVQACHGHRLMTKAPTRVTIPLAPGQGAVSDHRIPTHISGNRLEVRHWPDQSDSLQRHKVLRAESQQQQCSTVRVGVGGRGMSVHGLNQPSCNADCAPVSQGLSDTTSFNYYYLHCLDRKTKAQNG